MPNSTNKIIWYPDEIVFLIKNFNSHTARELLEHINSNRKRIIHIHSLRIKCYELGLFKNARYNQWLERETRFLINNYEKLGNVEISNRLNKYSNRSRHFNCKNIEKKMKLLCIRRNEISLKNIMDNNIKKGSWKKSQRIVAAKRRYPEGKKVILTIKGRNYYWMKHNGKMVAYHRYVWEINFGKIPAEYKIYFKDGNSLNCRPENLICSKGKIKSYNGYSSVVRMPAVFFEKEIISKKTNKILETSIPGL